MSAQSESPAWSMEEVTSIVRNMKNAFGSVHPGSFGMVMCDGSVRRIGYDIDRFVHQHLGVVDDGNVVGEF